MAIWRRDPPRPEPDDDRTLLWEGPQPQPAPPAAEERPRKKRGVAWRLARAALLVLLGYYVLCLVLLAVYRFVPPPTTG
ncbi:MAG TPA: hypothetical protein VF263_24600, partial [Longimicrobiaceae bacterium]